MVSQVTAIALIASGALAAGPQNQDQQTSPYYLQKVSQAAIKYLVKYKSAQIPEADASNAAKQIVDGVLAQASATELIQSGFSYYVTSGPNVDPTQVLQLVNRASSAYDAAATKTGYQSYADLVNAQQTAFDFNKAVTDASASALKFGLKYNGKINNAAVTASSKYYEFSQDPVGKAAIETGKELGKRIATDFKVTAVPSSVLQLKQLRALINYF